MVRKYILFAVSIALCVTVATFTNLPVLVAGNTIPDETAQPPVPIKFSHKLHIKDVGVDCATCHPAAATSTLSSNNLISTHDECGTCHEDQIASDCGFCHSDPENIVERPPIDRELIFSHQQHLGMTDVECTTCHKGMDEVTTAGAESLPDMATCNTCHNDRKATNTCEACHTDFVTLLPSDHRQADFLTSHRDESRLGALQTSCQTCHAETFCQQCHQGAGLKAFLPKDLSTEPRAKTWTRDTPKRTVLQNVHELNYRFTHGIDAKSKRMDCASCHSVETFCVACHEVGGNVSQGSFKPKSHSVPGFVVLGRGTGGGLHAEEARRDLESCVSCHDVEGRDPTCMACHTSTGQYRN